jgi:membrane-associated phospholipid phosphatase
MNHWIREIIKKPLATLPKLTRERIHQMTFAGVGLLFFGLFFKLSFNVFYDLKDATLLQHWDDQILLWVGSHRNSLLNQAAVDLTSLGSSTVVFLLVAIFIIIFSLFKDWFAIIHLGVATIGAGFCASAFKHILERSRPHVIPPLVEAAGFSFPSGHALVATALYVTFAILSSRHFSKVKQRATLYLLAIIVSLLVGLTRIYLGVHYPTDVISGMLLGGAWAFLVTALSLELVWRYTK